MKPTEKSNRYPVFEANQVLSHTHLNETFDYLDEQERLTRANLTGIGIVCGLEIKWDNSVITISRGCGITSQGYLIVEQAPLQLAYYNLYKLPDDLEYRPFKDNKVVLLELLTEEDAKDVNDKSELKNLGTDSSYSNFKNNGVVLLFLELKKNDLRTCCPASCDDNGTAVTATVRKLLVQSTDLGSISNSIGDTGGLSQAELEATMKDRLGLPDVRMPRFDVPANSITYTDDVLIGFFKALRKVCPDLGEALSSAYNAFKPLLKDDYASNPFANFVDHLSIKDILKQDGEKADEALRRALYIQNYYDFIDDLIRAYDEFRWMWIDLVCACCPPDGLFPRHLVLGSLSDPVKYRQQFLQSPALAGCSEKVKDLRQLFRRMVTMIESFNPGPELKEFEIDKKVTQICITPNRLGNGPLSEKAIPYYYTQRGELPLYRLWNVEKTRLNRAHHNLCYHSKDYRDPAAPDFVTSPLEYDLEPYNFLRIEGHLGKKYEEVVETLIKLKNRYRLPIEIIALSTGSFDGNLSLRQNNNRFPDLESLYRVWREELMCSLCYGVMYFYDIILEKKPEVPSHASGDAGKPALDLLVNYAPDFNYKTNTVGEWFEKSCGSFLPKKYLDVNHDKVDNNEIERIADKLYAGLSNHNNYGIIIYYIVKLAEIFYSELEKLDLTESIKRYNDLLGILGYFKNLYESRIDKNEINIAFVMLEDIIDHIDQMLASCKIEPLSMVYKEYQKRLKEIQEKMFLAPFLEKNPAIQHKAGVPLGGTFILVYHSNSVKDDSDKKTKRLYTDFYKKYKDFEQKSALDSAEVTEEEKALAVRSFMLKMVSEDAEFKKAIKKELPGIEEEQENIYLSGEFKAGTVPAETGSNFAMRMPLKEKPEEIISMTGGIKAGGVTTGAGGISGIKIPDIEKAKETFPLPEKMKPAIEPGSSFADVKEQIVIADFFLPYICCSNAEPIQFVLPVPPLGLNVQVGCTASTGKAQVTLAVNGGKAPYYYQLDSDSFRELVSNTIDVQTGQHCVVVRDIAGAESLPCEFDVPEQLVIGAENYADNIPKKTYTVSFTVSGGKTPYKTDTGQISQGNVFTSDAVKSGDKIKVTVTDSAGCTAVKEFNHTVPADNTLPCEGMALKRGYLFWLPDFKLEKELDFDNVSHEVSRFEIEYTEGEKFDLTDEVNNILKSKPTIIPRPGQVIGLDDYVNSWLLGINSLIQKKAGYKKWPFFTYQNPEQGYLGTLWIEHFRCLKFDIQIKSKLLNNSYEILYDQDGTRITNHDLFVPAFDCTLINRGDPLVKPVYLCKDVKLNFEIIANVQKNKVTLDYKPDFDAHKSCLWQAKDETTLAAGKPGLPVLLISNKKSTEFTFRQKFPLTYSKDIFLTVFNKEGCRGMKSTSVQLSAIG